MSAALAAALLVLAPATALAALPAVEAPALPAATPAVATAGVEEAIAAYAQGFPQGAGLGAQILAAGALAPGLTVAPIEGVTFEQAFAALYEAAGLPPTHVDAPEGGLAEALAPLVASAAVSGAMVQEALAPLSAEDRAFLEQHLHLAWAPAQGDAQTQQDLARLRSLAAQVDVPRIVLAAAILGSAVDAFPSQGYQANAWTDPRGLVEVGSTGNECFTLPRVLIVDLGGNDCYTGRPGAHGPGSPLPLPVSAILELGGDDNYQATTFGPSETTYGIGVGILGIGLVADRWGNDAYSANVVNSNAGCPQDFWTGNRQMLHTQGVGALGVGAVLDLSGNDRYEALNTNTIETNCHFGWTYTFAQGVGLTGGLGLLVDDLGHDAYTATARATGEYDNIAHTHAQAVALGGIGVLADKEGNDAYSASADAVLGSATWKIKGDFAYVFAQGSVAATRMGPDALGTSGLGSVLPGLLGGCIVTPVIPRYVCLGGDQGKAVSCRILAGSWNSNDAGCDTPGVAILLDALGSDTFTARPFASDRGLGCSAASWAVSSSQGSAAWGGLAILATFDETTSDLFQTLPYAQGNGCGWLGTRAMAYGQGFGGAILWDFWDVPYLAGENVAVGILANGSPLRNGCPNPQGTSQVARDLGLNVAAPAVNCAVVPTTMPVAAAPDVAYAYPIAVNPGTQWCFPTCPAGAEAWVQGSAQRQVYTVQSGMPTQPVQAIGIGLHLDAGGNDANLAYAHALGKVPGVDAQVVAQGASRGGIGIHADAGGDDRYDAMAWHNGIAQPAKVQAQGAASGVVSLGTPATCAILTCVPATAVTSIPAVGVLLDVSGWDTYSQGACPGNGVTFGAWLGLLGPRGWGNAPVLPNCGASSGLVVGFDHLSELGL
jgi:hypothetical protein